MSKNVISADFPMPNMTNLQFEMRDLRLLAVIKISRFPRLLPFVQFRNALLICRSCVNKYRGEMFAQSVLRCHIQNQMGSALLLMGRGGGHRGNLKPLLILILINYIIEAQQISL